MVNITENDDNNSSEAHDTFQTDRYIDHPASIEELEVSGGIHGGIVVQSVKISAPDQRKDDNSPMLHTSTRGASVSAIPEQVSDTASVQSLPEVYVTEPESTLQRRASIARATDLPTVTNTPPPSPSFSTTPQEEGAFVQQQRRARHRSTAEVRSSNRISGFFTNLIHRRDNLITGASRNTTREDTSTSAPGQNSQTQSRSSSPTPGRSVTPPPPLPAPTLQELGLSLSVLTSDLSPSHFTTPPSSGAFLAPHYLLLCHAQGLDVLPLVSPPALQPYALVRRVNFKSVVVMEQRGVLVAIAGRRDGVRVYALEEVKRAIEWRIEMEARRERDRSRRETMKKLNSIDSNNESRDSADIRKNSLSTPAGGNVVRNSLLRKGSHGTVSLSSRTPNTATTPLIPRSPTQRAPKKSRTPQIQMPTQMSSPSEHPPPYTSPLSVPYPPRLQRQISTLSFNPRSRSGSVNNVLATVPHNADANRLPDVDVKTGWVESSDDEAINIVAAGPSGSQALDERTSTRLPPSSSEALSIPPVLASAQIIQPHSPTSPTRRNRPSNLDLTLSRSSPVIPEPSPSPTLLTLRQALSHSPPTLRNIHGTEAIQEPDTPFGTVDEDEDGIEGGISLAQALLESRIPDLPPLGTRRPQQPILLTSSHPVASMETEPSSPQISEGHESLNNHDNTDRPERRRRRWSVLLRGSLADGNESTLSSPSSIPSTAPLPRDGSTPRFTRSHSFRSGHSHTSTIRPPSSLNHTPTRNPSTTTLPDLPENHSIFSSRSSRSSRFIPRMITNAFHGRRSDDCPALPILNASDTDSTKKVPSTPLTPHAPPPKLEYVKLPGTKGALMVKAVETAKKSFLAILCGENGEKVELFAGTYRTALGLSRTFILPDSPRSLELQLQGDDLVEVFLVFSQNVFGLEPATVRVREVRIGRAERRAARRRAREVRAGETTHDSEAALADEDTNVNVNIGVSVAVGSTVAATGNGPDGSQTPPLIAAEHPDAHQDTSTTPNEPVTSIANSEELITLATAQMGPYTTFQQLTFAPKFPLASIADEYIIPPTYSTFLEYRAEHEPEEGSMMDLTRVQFSPPGLPVPIPTAPSRWYYRDPKDIIHGPWKAALMQAWYKDGLLPPDLPVRREEDDSYMLLKDLRLQSIDPTHPFQSPPPPTMSDPAASTGAQRPEKPLLSPISLLSQPRHFGPPALFFSSRGGHSTAIVDARGRSVLKGRFFWSVDQVDEESKPALVGRMGDIKRLEALDIQDRAILIAMRQGGLEAVDLSDALLQPADESRTVLPQFAPPPSNINRRAPFVWKIGTPVSASSTSATILSSKGKGGHPHGKKQSTGSTKSPVGRTEFSLGDVDQDPRDEVLFLGRKDDELYFCERNAGSFRILRLCPNLLQ